MAAVAAVDRHPTERRLPAFPRTRLEPPPLRQGLVERPALLARLAELTTGPLTLVAAPTGYGKTTLLASWAGGESRPIAWATLVAGDGDAPGFWRLVAAALGEALPDLPLESRAGPVADRPAEDAARLLARSLCALDRDVVLVLDDYQHAAGRPTERSLGRFLELVPERVHVVLSTRREPDLSLALRRSRGLLGELRARDLRLDEAAVAALVRETAGLALDRAEAARLAGRTEGWPAGVYLAALAARGASQPDELLAGFTGAAREVADYLRAELLDVQADPKLRRFLLATSIFERLSAPLCDTLLRRRDSPAVLDALVHTGCFLEPAGEGGELRYQRTVAEFLRSELVREDANSLPALHRRAAAACERFGLVDEAAAHALAAGEEREAATILGRHVLELVRRGRTGLFPRLLGTAAGAAAARRRTALADELRRLDAAGSDPAGLLEAAERVSSLCAKLPGGPARTLARATATAARAYALLLAGRVAEAYAAGVELQTGPVAEAPAAVAEATAVASLAADRLGLRAAAAPLARSSAAALSTGGVGPGRATALAAAAAAAVLAAAGEHEEAERRCDTAAATAGLDPPTRVLALVLLARLRAEQDAAGARRALAAARESLAGVPGAELLETLAAEVDATLAPRRREPPERRELSRAERRVLRLLTTTMTQREIASELYLSPNTVKTHTRVIYRKLDVSSRQAAVDAAHELNLVQ